MTGVVAHDCAYWSGREALGETWRWYVNAPLDGWRNNVTGAATGAQRTLVIEGDPRPLLPADGWNVEPIPLDVEPITECGS